MKLTFAYSPCPNDTFMFEPIVKGRINTEGLRFEIHLADVEKLNQSAFHEKYDISKLSFNAYTQLTNRYQLLNSGSALGRNCGPLLISKEKKSLDEINSGIIAIPGKNTTANFLLSYAFPDIQKKKEMIFSEVEKEVLNNNSDAGVIIHENRFTYEDKGLHKIQDLGEHWENTTGFPIPLGGIVTRREFTLELKQKIDRVIARSVRFAIENPNSGKEYIKMHAQEMDESVMKSHIDLYVNTFSADIGEEGKASIDFLFKNHPNTKNGDFTSPLFIPRSPIEYVSNAFLSTDYWTSRYENAKTGWDVGTITTPIKEYVDQIDDRSLAVLIPGAGNGHEAEYLHRLGFTNVTVCDISETPLINLVERCPSFPQKKTIKGDFFELSGTFDLILEQTFFCALDPSLRNNYVEKMHELLAPKGKLVGLMFGVEFPFTGPPFGGNQQEYANLFDPYFDIQVLEDSINSIPPREGSELFLIALRR